MVHSEPPEDGFIGFHRADGFQQPCNDARAKVFADQAPLSLGRKGVTASIHLQHLVAAAFGTHAGGNVIGVGDDMSEGIKYCLTHTSFFFNIFPL